MYHYHRPEDVGFVKYLSKTAVYIYFHYRHENDYFHYRRHVNNYFHYGRENDYFHYGPCTTTSVNELDPF